MNSERPSKDPENVKFSPLVQFLRSKGFPNLTVVHIQYLLGPHHSLNDAESVVDSIADNAIDVFLSEGIGRPHAHRDQINAADGSTALSTNAFEDSLVRALRQRNVPFGYVDVSQSEKKEYERVLKDQRRLAELPGKLLAYKNYDRARKEFDTFSKLFSDGFIRMRNDKIFRTIGPEIVSLAEKGLISREKESLNIAIFSGSIHSGVAHKLAKQGERVHMSWPESPFIFKYFDELMRYREFKGKPTVELISNAMTELLVGYFLLFAGDRMAGDTDVQQVSNFRRIAGSLTESEKREFYDICTESPVQAYDFCKSMIAKYIAKN